MSVEIAIKDKIQGQGHYRGIKAALKSPLGRETCENQVPDPEQKEKDKMNLEGESNILIIMMIIIIIKIEF